MKHSNHKFTSILLLIWLCFFLPIKAYSQTIFKIYNERQEFKAILIGVFHSGLQISSNLSGLVESKSNNLSGVIIEQNPTGGWSPELASDVLKIHSITTSQLIKNERLKCLAAAEQPTSNLGSGYAALFSSGPAAYVLMNVKPYVLNAPEYFSKKVSTTEQWLVSFSATRKKKLIFLEDHIDPFKQLKEFTPKELGQIAENHCLHVQSGHVKQKEYMLDVSQLINNFELGDFDSLRQQHKDSFMKIGWTDKLLKNQYEDREKLFVEKILTTFKEERGTFIISVGAAHIGGETGLLALLRAKGFTITTCNLKKNSSCDA